jgi:hypothetical protein
MDYRVDYDFITFGKPHSSTVVVTGASSEGEAREAVTSRKRSATITSVSTDFPPEEDNCQVIAVRRNI